MEKEKAFEINTCANKLSSDFVKGKFRRPVEILTKKMQGEVILFASRLFHVQALTFPGNTGDDLSHNPWKVNVRKC